MYEKATQRIKANLPTARKEFAGETQMSEVLCGVLTISKVWFCKKTKELL